MPEIPTTPAQVFPFTVHCDGYGQSPPSFVNDFLRTRPREFGWYCFDVEVHSRTKVTFVVFGMQDNFSGGKGSEAFRFDADVPSATTAQSVSFRLRLLAEARREAELHAAEEKIIQSYVAEILSDLEAQS